MNRSELHPVEVLLLVALLALEAAWLLARGVLACPCASCAAVPVLLGCRVN